MLAASQHDRSTKLDAKLDAIVVTAGGITATPTFLLMLRGEGPERAARGEGMVGGGRHHTPPPSEDVRRGRATHTLPPFCPSPYHTLPTKTPESSRERARCEGAS